MDILKYCVSLRSELLEVVSGVENSGYSFSWDTTTPNWATKTKLEKLYKRYLMLASRYGLYVVTIHSPCGSSTHPENPGYITENDYGLDIAYQDKNYVWLGLGMYQGPRHTTCPCSDKSRVTDHYVNVVVIFKNNADQEVCKVLESILYDIHEAIECAEHKKTRSAIRENLLLAILKINDAILPESMEEYIQARLTE